MKTTKKVLKVMGITGFTMWCVAFLADLAIGSGEQIIDILKNKD